MDNPAKIFPTPLTEPRYSVPTGYDQLDKATGGLESRRTYIVGGLNKSGKSTLVMNILDNMMTNGVAVGVLDTELDQEDYFKRMAAIANRVHEQDEFNTKELQESWKEVFYKTNLFQYADKLDVLEKGLIDIYKIESLFDQWRILKTKVFVIDNVTTIQNQLVNGKQGYEILRVYIDRLQDYAKQHNIILVLILHTKGSELVFTESSSRINQLIEDQTPHKIFEKTVTVNTRPSKVSLYGGQSILSQVSGGIILLWRPYQDFRDITYQKMGMLILEDWRSKPKAFTNEIEVWFNENESRYYTVEVRNG